MGLASAALGLVLAAVLLILVLAIRSQREASGEARRAQDVIAAITVLEVSVLDLETGVRGYLLTGRRSFLAPWQGARRRLPAEEARLRAVTAKRPERSTADDINGRVNAYVENYSKPVVALVRPDHRRALSLLVSGIGKRRVDDIRRRLAALTRREETRARTAREAADGRAAEALLIGSGGLVLSVALVLLFALYLSRAIVRPVRRVAHAARGLAAGDLAARVPRSGDGEVAELGGAFNTMAASLEEGRGRIEEQRRALEASVRRLEEQEARVRAVLDATPDAIAVLDASGRTVLENPPMRSVRTALVHSVGAGGGHRTPVSGGDGDGDPTGEVRDELELVGTGRTFARYVAPVGGRSGVPAGRLVVLREITREREADRVKDEFFALVSHELRTPLTSILGYLELVLDDEREGLAEAPRRHLEVVQRNARRLLRLVGDLLFVAQVEAGTLALTTGPVDLARVTREAVEAAGPRAEVREVALVSELSPVALSAGDRDRLGQVLDNLIVNAIKFTPAGGTVRVRLRAEGGTAVLEVADTGRGIPEREQAHLFDRFYRAASATSGAVPGVGLGLAIVKAIAEAHGGRVTVRSTEGQGASFAVELPGARAQPAPPPTSRAEPATGGR